MADYYCLCGYEKCSDFGNGAEWGGASYCSHCGCRLERDGSCTEMVPITLLKSIMEFGEEIALYE
jgi:hypothetical protein